MASISNDAQKYVQASGVLSFRNKLINGEFNIWQRGHSTFTADFSLMYTADRWGIEDWSALGTGSLSVFPGFWTGAEIATNSTFMQVAATNAFNAAIYQCIEGAATLSGKEVVVTAFLNYLTGSNTTPLADQVKLTRNWGVGSAFPVEHFAASSVTYDATTKILTARFFLPEISRDAHPGNYLALSLKMSGTFTANLLWAQLEEGTVATPLERRPLGTELAMCQRYYEKSYDLNTPPGTATSHGRHASVIETGWLVAAPCIPFAVEKRTSPTITIYSPQNGGSGNLAEYDYGSTFIANRPATLTRASTKAWECQSGNGTMTVAYGQHIGIQWTALAEL
jgi:hypothetical protein